MDTTEEMKKAGFVYREPPVINDSSPEYLKKKKELCDKVLKHSFTIDVRALE